MGWIRRKTPPHRVLQIAQLFVDANHPAAACRLLSHALKRDDLSQAEQYTLKRHAADLVTGMERWLCLLEAVTLAEADSPTRAYDLTVLLREVDAKAAATLATKTSDPSLQSAFRIRQAELTLDERKAAEIYWQEMQEGRLPPSKMQPACRTLVRAGQPLRAVEFLEDKLRQDEMLPKSLLASLSEAYLAAGRPRDAERAQWQ
jgi:hypothetical protein